MEEEIKTHAEVVGDVGVLLGFVKQMNLPELLDHHIKRHHLDQGLSWGWVISIWLVYIVSQGDHRKVTVEDWIAQMHETLELLTGLEIRKSDFTDDRLTIALRHLSGDERSWAEPDPGLCSAPGDHSSRCNNGLWASSGRGREFVAIWAQQR